MEGFSFEIDPAMVAVLDQLAKGAGKSFDEYLKEFTWSALIDEVDRQLAAHPGVKELQDFRNYLIANPPT